MGETPYTRKGKSTVLAANYEQSLISLNQNDIFPQCNYAVNMLLR